MSPDLSITFLFWKTHFMGPPRQALRDKIWKCYEHLRLHLQEGIGPCKTPSLVLYAQMQALFGTRQ